MTTPTNCPACKNFVEETTTEYITFECGNNYHIPSKTFDGDCGNVGYRMIVQLQATIEELREMNADFGRRIISQVQVIEGLQDTMEEQDRVIVGLREQLIQVDLTAAPNDALVEAARQVVNTARPEPDLPEWEDEFYVPAKSIRALVDALHSEYEKLVNCVCGHTSMAHDEQGWCYHQAEGCECKQFKRATLTAAAQTEKDGGK